ncbi:unnamed protein product [Coregonus sp. 'balchen']|nr:unnamed protein product [Coregonus sp. 'balchen']
MSAEETQIRRFVSGQLRECPDLSTLTLAILRGRYLASVGRDSLSQEDRQLMKRVVEEELMRMQDSDSSDDEAILDVTPMPRHNKRNRGEEKGGRTKAEESKAKRSRLHSAQSDSPDSGIERVGNGEGQREEEEEEKDMGSDVEDDQVSQTGTKKKRGGHKGVHNGGETEISSESEVEIKTVNRRKREQDSDEVEENKKKKQGDETNKQEKDKVNSDRDSEEDKKQKRKRRMGGKNVDVKVQSKGSKGTRRRESGNEEKKGKPLRRRERVQVVGSDSERIGEAKVMEQNRVERQRNDDDSRSESEGENNASSEEASGGEEETEEVMAKTKDEPAQDSDSGSSLPALEDEKESEDVRPEQVKKRKPVAKQPIKDEGSERASKGGKDDEAKAVTRLRRYIALCGVRRNYKKLLDGCHSIKSKVAVLKRELEELGVKGQPSIEKCRNARLEREEAQELADLDVSNIITTQGRPKRRGVSKWQQQSSPYKRVVNSSSDSEGDSHAGRGRKRATDWSNLQGIISDGADSD